MAHANHAQKGEHAEHANNGGDIQRPDGPSDVPGFGWKTFHGRFFRLVCR
jgi:hypothetical protein